MSIYSIEDKIFIEQFVSANSLDMEMEMENEEKWQELGGLMNRDWKDIRKMYQNWKIQDNQSESARELENNDQSEYQNLDLIINEFLSASESNSCDVIGYLDIDGRLIKTDQIQYVEYPPLHPLTNQINSTTVQSTSEKRPREVLQIETNTDLVKIFENQSIRELELKRQEHEEKMMIYKQQLIHGAELHRERMKILKAKLKAIEEKVENIDNMICNKNNLKKKFKSGPV